MDEHNENEQVDTNLGISRRTVLRRGAVVGGSLVWAAPAVQSITRSAFASHTGTPHDGACPCQFATARGIVVDASGTLFNLSAVVGQAPPNDQLANVSVPGLTGPVVTADLVTVTADASDDVCHASAEVATVAIDLRNIDPLLDAHLTAGILRAESTACPQGACSSHIVNLTGSVAGVPVNEQVAPPANTTVVDASAAGLTAKLVLNEQETVDGGCRVRALHLTVGLNVLGITQDVTVIISEAHAG